MSISGARLGDPIQVGDLLRASLETRPDDDAVIAHGTRLTWRELEASSTRLAANLVGLGLEPGDRVASLMPNRVELVLHYLACIKVGLVATPLNYRYMAPEIDHALEVSGASTLLAHTERDADLAKSKLVGELPLGVIRYGAAAGASPRIEELIGRNPPDVKLSPLNGNSRDSTLRAPLERLIRAAADRAGFGAWFSRSGSRRDFSRPRGAPGPARAASPSRALERRLRWRACR